MKAYHSRESEEDKASSPVLSVERMNPAQLSPASEIDPILEEGPPERHGMKDGGRADQAAVFDTLGVRAR